MRAGQGACWILKHQQSRDPDMLEDHGDVRTSISFNGGPKIEVDLEKVRQKMEGHDALRNYVDRLVRLSEQKAETVAEIKELAEKAKGDGFSKKALMMLVAQEMETADQRAERLAVAEELDRMKSALGMFQDTPLGAAAMQAAAE